MAKRFFIATLNGQTFTRSTASRAYTHMAAVRPSYDAALRNAKADHCDVSNFNYWLAMSQGISRSEARTGQVETQTLVEYHTSKWTTPEQAQERADRDQARAIENLKGATTVEEYTAARLADRIAAVEAQKADGYFDRFQDAGWASRLDLAQKNAASHAAKAWWAEAKVLEAVEVDGPTFRALTKAAK